MGADEPTWLSWRIVAAIHFEQILQHGGEHGVRDRGLIESALERPRFKWQYEQGDLVALGGAYGFAITKNHGFRDGNKRAGFMAMYVFLGLNGLEIDAPEEEVVRVMEGVAKGAVSEAALVEWLRGRTVALEEEPE